MLLLIASCGAEADIPEPVVEPSEETAPPTSAEPQPDTTLAPSSEDPPEEGAADSGSAPGGPPAPDFTLELGGGGTFALSEQNTPVLIIFWAEW